MAKGKEIYLTIRKDSPCKGCTERFTACHDDCPKDARGEYGHKAWTAEIERVKAAREEYIRKRTKKHYHY